MEETKEIWKTINEFPNYQVSNLGRVKSIERVYYCGNHKSKRIQPETILKTSIIKGGYIRVPLGGCRKQFLVHRLVAQAFLPNQDNLQEINHKDENPSNNNVENLEWCTAKYNINFGTRNERVAKVLTNGKKSKPVICVETGIIFPSTAEVQRELGFSQGNICSCCNGKYKQAYGFHWEWAK